MNEFPTGFSIDTIEDSDHEPNTISFQSRNISHEHELTSTHSNELIDEISDMENLEPIPMRRQPSSMGQIMNQPSLLAPEILEEEEEITADEVPRLPMMLRRQNAISPVYQNVSILLLFLDKKR